MSGQVFNIDGILFDLFDNGGGSYSVLVTEDHGDQYIRANATDGYMVSVAGFGRTIGKGGTTSTVGDWSDQLHDFVHSVYLPYFAGATLSVERVPFLGIWWDSESELWYLDVSLYIKDERDAIELAMSTGELAIWDNEKREEIRMVG